jgi:hypothetical protein
MSDKLKNPLDSYYSTSGTYAKNGFVDENGNPIAISLNNSDMYYAALPEVVVTAKTDKPVVSKDEYYTRQLARAR